MIHCQLESAWETSLTATLDNTYICQHISGIPNSTAALLSLLFLPSEWVALLNIVPSLLFYTRKHIQLSRSAWSLKRVTWYWIFKIPLSLSLYFFPSEWLTLLIAASAALVHQETHFVAGISREVYSWYSNSASNWVVVKREEKAKEVGRSEEVGGWRG